MVTYIGIDCWMVSSSLYCVTVLVGLRNMRKIAQEKHPKRTKSRTEFSVAVDLELIASRAAPFVEHGQKILEPDVVVGYVDHG